MYAVDGATDIRFFEAPIDIPDETDSTKYVERSRLIVDLFNGRMKMFAYELKTFEEKWVILTYNSPGKFHVSDPIRLRHKADRTQNTNTLVNINAGNVNPEFDWSADTEPENIIYFQAISDEAGNLISGTYTTDRHWRFYNTDNVVLNVTPESSTPELIAGQTYTFTLMGVSEDNWVYSLAQLPFSTD